MTLRSPGGNVFESGGDSEEDDGTELANDDDDDGFDYQNVQSGSDYVVELEGLSDSMRREVSMVRKRIDTVNKELKKEKEYKEALEAFNEKSKEKAQLVSKLMELVSESERLRMKKLEELTKNIENLR